MPSDPVKARARERRYRLARKVERYGPEAAQTDMRGRHGNHARGSANGKWNRDRMLSSHGYVLVRVGARHPLAFGNGYAYEHDLVWVAAHGPLARGEIVHHKNEEKTDNRIENLVCQTRSDHGRLHAETRQRDIDGTFASGGVE